VTRFPSHLADNFDALIELLRARGVRDLQLDSRRVQPGDAFVAVPGRRSDGRTYIEAAVAQGAAAILVEAQGWHSRDVGAPVLPVASLTRDLGHLAAAWYRHPSATLTSIGVTGTNGKTSCSQWIAQALMHAGRRCGVIGTVGSGFPDALEMADLTTPDAVSLQRVVRRLADEGAQALAMEVSSIGLDQGRADGMHFDTAVFTNLTRDHLDYHATMAAYGSAKARLFDWPTLRHAVINLDDAFGRTLAHGVMARAHGPAVIGYALAQPQETGLALQLVARDLRVTAHGLAFTIDAGAEQAAVEVNLVGQFNVSNLLAVTGALIASGMSLAQAAALLPQLAAAAGTHAACERRSGRSVGGGRLRAHPRCTRSGAACAASAGAGARRAPVGGVWCRWRSRPGQAGAHGCRRRGGRPDRRHQRQPAHRGPGDDRGRGRGGRAGRAKL
jgi:UDP-N-acetylmuramyl-tripeptide synthetase